MTSANWAGNYFYRASALHRPTSIAEVQEFVAAAQQVKALGSRHSFNDVADSDGVQLSLADMPTELTINAAERTVTVNAGARYGDFAEQLAAKAGRVPTVATAPETGLEKQLTRLLLAALVIAGLVVAVLEGGSWFQADPAAWSVAGNPWVLALLACLGASQGAELLRRRLD